MNLRFLMAQPATDYYVWQVEVCINNFIKKQNASLVQEIERPSPDGGVKYELKASPYVVMEKQYHQLFRLYAAEFGLTPRGRSGLSVGDNKDDGDDLLTCYGI